MTKPIFKINYPKFNEVMGNPNISPGAKITLWWLIQHGRKGGDIFPSQERLSSLIGRCTKQIRIYIKELIVHEIVIETWREQYPASNHYLLNEEIYRPEYESGGGGSDETPMSDLFERVFPVEIGSVVPTNNSSTNNKENNNLSYLHKRDRVDVPTLLQKQEDK